MERSRDDDINVYCFFFFFKLANNWQRVYNYRAKENKLLKSSCGAESKPAGDGERGRVQYNYPGTFQGWYVKLAHCAAADNVTAYNADGQPAHASHGKRVTHKSLPSTDLPFV